MTNDRNEADLIRVLADAADHAPALTRDLAGAVRVRTQARRRTHRARVALVCAAVVAIATSPWAIRGVLPGGSGPEGGVFAGASEAPGTVEVSRRPVPRPVSEVWPKAVSRIPTKAADGLTYQPAAALSPTTLLLIAESSFERAARLDTYDTTTGRSEPLVRLPSPEGRRNYYVQRIEVGTDTIAWWGDVQDDDTWADFWVAPRTGGTARQVGEVTGALAKVEGFGVTRDSLVWSVRGGGVYRMPLEGGAPQPVPGAEGLTLISWPWASDVSLHDDRNQTKLVNLSTGQTLPVNPPEGAEQFRCGPVWCSGLTKEGNIVQRVDGSDRRIPSAFSGPSAAPLRMLTTGFLGPAQGPSPRLSVLYDPETDKAAGFGERTTKDQGWYGVGRSSTLPSVLYTTPKGIIPKGPDASEPTCEEKCTTEKYLVVNLLAILTP
ncbi:hypothetical protein [Streptosporangium jomthongense]|uniref:Uncharacterized protein n=1 Tax=Streptosporangium jomthongense TaxID=1193683 RepID=A0ABV8F2I7_9ACTN